MHEWQADARCVPPPLQPTVRGHGPLDEPDRILAPPRVVRHLDAGCRRARSVVHTVASGWSLSVDRSRIVAPVPSDPSAAGVASAAFGASYPNHLYRAGFASGRRFLMRSQIRSCDRHIMRDTAQSRNTATGSIREARRAGSQPANAPMAARTVAATANVTGSR